MSHELEIINGKAQMFSVKEIPWHKMGKILDNPPTSEKAIVEAGLDWNVNLKQIYFKDETAPIDTYNQVNNRFALVRDRYNEPLCVVSGSYKPLQNKKAFEWFDPIVKEGKATYETAGSLQGGRKIWILAKLKDEFEVVAGDTIRKYLLLCNGHDGATSILIQLSPIRVVCQNTLLASLGTGMVNSIVHHGNIEMRMDMVKRMIGLAEKEYEQRREIYQNMARYSMDNNKIGLYLQALIPDARKEATERVRNTINADRERIWQLIETGMGSGIKNVKGTLWGTYNASIEFAEYYMAKRVRDIPNYQLFGLGAQFKQRAFNLAVDAIK